MEAIKKKLSHYKVELEAAHDKAHLSEIKMKEHKARADAADSEIIALNRRIRLLEIDLEKTEKGLEVTSQKYEEAIKVADESERMRKLLEHKTQTDNERTEALEKQLLEARNLAQDSDRKYDEASRKLNILEVTLDKADERARTSEKKKAELEEELKLLGNSLRALEIREEKTLERQQAYEQALKTSKQRLVEAESRFEAADKNVTKLKLEVERLEDLLTRERGKFQHISDELDQTYSELTAH